MTLPTRESVATPPPTRETDSETPTSNRNSFITREFLLRSLTAIVLLPVVLLAMLSGGNVWALLVMVLVVIGTLEFHNMAHGTLYAGGAWIGVPAAMAVVLAFTLDVRESSLLVIGLLAVTALVAGLGQHKGRLRNTLKFTAMTLTGLLYIAVPGSFLIAVRGLSEGLLWLVVIVSMTWGTDTFAYLGGRRWGRHKLAPRLSPNKTVEGAVIGALGGFLPALVFLHVTDHLSAATLLMIALGPFIAILGDLLESALKRTFAIKDSHLPGLNIIPGHGGILDRVDALLLVSAYVYGFINIVGLTG